MDRKYQMECAVAVVVATKNRFKLLSQRTIPSILSQSREPDYLIVVDDSDFDKRQLNKELISSLSLPICQIIYQENNRTPGASGCWNSAIDYLFNAVTERSMLYMAFIDDDDSWEHSYLKTCLSAAFRQNLDMLATGFSRYEQADGQGILQYAPQTLNADDFLVGNPGIQGSNLFLKLSTLLAAGGFDESLSSATDRDLCIRLSDLGYVRYQSITEVLVNHFAEANRPRLSTPESAAKKNGLDSFWLKYVTRMSCEQQLSFKKRAKELFNWQPQLNINYSQRIENAKHHIEKCFYASDLRPLGAGLEAVVLTDGVKVYKCFDHWQCKQPNPWIDFLRSQVNKWKKTPGLYEINNLTVDGSWVIITYLFENSRPYTGQHEEEVLELLVGCQSQSIVCNNLHPKNLIIAESGVKLIDYGADIKPWSPLGFEHMARRAYLTIHHAQHRHLKQLMRDALLTYDLPEMSGYSEFKRKLNQLMFQHSPSLDSCLDENKFTPDQGCFPLLVGIISSDPTILKPLLESLLALSTCSAMAVLKVTVLDNGCPQKEFASLINTLRQKGLQVAVISREQQMKNAAEGVFGSTFSLAPDRQVGIAQARTMIQRYVGEQQRIDTRAFVWLLDDDMRVDHRAAKYLQWLPQLAEKNIDVLIGHYEGASPNPPINSIRIQLVDLLHNLLWLQNLDADAFLPDRSEENRSFREQYPDYYYDLSRKHKGHLEKPYWLEPTVEGETVREANTRLLSNAVAMLSGFPLTRPIVATMTDDPFSAMKPSVNRGGITFVLNHAALTETPNAILNINGREARRSDMIWAIINHYYRQLNIQAIPFPVYHVGRVSPAPDLNIEKVQSEISGSSLYGGLTEFLSCKPNHRLSFNDEELKEVCRLTQQHLLHRLNLIEQSFFRINGLKHSLLNLSVQGELDDLLGYLERWFTVDNFKKIKSGVLEGFSDNIAPFLDNIKRMTDDYANGSVDISFIKAQLQKTGPTSII